MGAYTETEIRDVKDIRQNFQKVNHKNKFKKSLFGYHKKQINSYLETLESNKELEKNAFLERLKELETVIKNLNVEKEDWEIVSLEKQSKLQELEQQTREQAVEILKLAGQLGEYQTTISECEEELKKREDAVVFFENQNLKMQMQSLTEERNEYAAKLETYKNENTIFQKKVSDLDSESTRLSELLAKEAESHRKEFLEVSLLVSKLVENNRYFCDKTLQGLETLLFGNQKTKSETESIISQLKEKKLI